jgi:galactokinase/mevalonate kinase-like predicted kinase
VAVVRSKSPLRISFAGGGTDVLPYMADHGGVVLSATIDKYALLHCGCVRKAALPSPIQPTMWRAIWVKR